MPHRRKKSVDEGRPPKQRGANRRKSQPDPIAQTYAERQEGWPETRSRRPRKASAKRKRSGATTRRGKKVAAAKRPTRRRRAA